MFSIRCLGDFDYDNITLDKGAVIYADIDGICFPDDEWYDLPLSVLDMWCWNLIGKFHFRRAEFQLFFMDGPFFIRCLKDNENVQMQFVNDRRDDEQIVAECFISFEELVTAVYKASNQVVSMLARHQITDLPGLLSLKKS